MPKPEKNFQYQCLKVALELQRLFDITEDLPPYNRDQPDRPDEHPDDDGNPPPPAWQADIAVAPFAEVQTKYALVFNAVLGRMFRDQAQSSNQAAQVSVPVDIVVPRGPAVSGVAAPAVGGVAAPAVSGVAAPAVSGVAAPAVGGVAAPAVVRLGQEDTTQD